MILLNPGPTNTRESTKNSQHINSDVCHREKSFQLEMENLKKDLVSRSEFADQIGLMAGSGTTALESMIVSLCPDDTLLVNAGNYGLRAEKIFKAYGIRHSVVSSLNIDDLEFNDKIKNVYFVENETSTCETYSLSRMINIYPNANFFIDATSSFGASNYSKYSTRINALSFCSNKCLQSTPGLGIVLWKSSLPIFKRGSFFLNLENYGLGKLPFTIPVQSVYALSDAMKHNKDNQLIFERRRNNLIKAFDELNIKCINIYPSNSIVGFVHPKLDYNTLSEKLIDEGVVIYSGIENIENSFRIATMSCLFDEKYQYILKTFEKTVL